MLNPYKLYQSALRSPKSRWIIIALTIIYFISPIDLIPDIFLGPGQIDDGILLTVFVSELVKMSRERKAKQNLENTQK
jgi:uncharacterized membrane protein YkvA (DUF1232 family)